MLIFIYDRLLNELDKLKLPLTFLSFAYVSNMKLIWSRKHYVMVGENIGKRRYGNDLVYGALFDLREGFVNIRIIDAYYACSKSRLHENNPYDLMYRQTLNATPITFSSLDDFSSYKFKRFEKLKCEAYLGNIHDASLTKTLHAGRKRCEDGVDKTSFKKFYENFKEDLKCQTN